MSRYGRLAAAIMRAPYPLRLAAVNAYGWRLARKRFGGEFRRVLAELEASQWLSAVELRAAQEAQLRSLISHAYDNVPYYGRVMQERSLRPRDIETVDDLRKLPFLTKEILNECFDDLTSRDAARKSAELHRTSGTTGVQLRGFLLPSALRWPLNYADLYRAYRWAGFEQGQRRATIAGRWFTTRAPFTTINHAENQLLLSAHHMNEKTLPDYIRALENHHPAAIQGHPSAIATIATYILDQGRRLSVSCILTTGEQLYDDQRRQIEAAFGGVVFDGWGQGENVGRAYECDRHEGYHISTEFGILEIEEGEDGHGEIIATSLHNDVMPFIRYRTGDLGAWSEAPCSCGRGLPLLRDLLGRVDDLIEDVEGHPVLPVSIRTRLSALKDLREYQLAQHDHGYTIVCVLPAGEDVRTLQEVESALEDLLGDGARIRVERVAEIPRTAGGKVRLIVDTRSSSGMEPIR